MRVVVRSGFDRFSGYGNDAIDLAVNLEKAGVDVTPLPTSLLPGLPREFTRLLEKDPRGRKDVLLEFAPPFDLKAHDVEGLARRMVGYTMWERTPVTPQDFLGHAWGTNDLTLRGWDRLVVTCPMNVEALRPMAGDVPIDVVPCGIESEDWPVVRRDPARPLTFLMIGMLNGRKDPFALLETWRDLCREHPEFDARLRVHTLAPGLHPAVADGAYGPRIELSSKPLSREQVVALYHDCDVLVSTSRGEGNNKPAMEFMATGGTVAATDWSGHQNWLHRDVAYPLPGSLVPARNAPEGVSEFAVDREALAATLLHCWKERAEVTRKGELAAAWIRQTHAWPVVTEKLIRSLEAA